jgi:3-dehydroquinate dehydratase-2
MKASAKKVTLHVVHGPNLNLLGEREPEIYGKLTLREVNALLQKHARARGVTLQFFQANSEGALIDELQRVRKRAHGVVFNPGAYTHYSYALRDAVAALPIPVIEVHLSDLRMRAQTEPFRGKSVIAPVCYRQISGLGWRSYSLAIDELAALARKASTSSTAKR